LDKHKADKARRELAHALEALEDGAGRSEWGPGPVLMRLGIRSGAAADAFTCAALATHDLLLRTSRPAVIHAIRVLAPVFLELAIDVCDTCRMKPCHKLCASQLKEPLP